MKYTFHPAAEAELDEAVAFYNAERSQLGLEFLKDVYSTLERVLQHPAQFARLSRQVRRAKTQRFPYGIVYGTKEDEIYILAVMHLSRKPNYWKERLR